MAKAATKPISNEVPQKDFAGAVRAYRQDIKPAISKVGEFSQEVSTAYKHIKKNCHIQSGAAKQAFKLAEMEDAKRDDYLRSFNGLLKELKITMPRPDLADMAEGKGQESIIPEAERPKPQLVAVGKTDGAGPEDEDQEDADPEGGHPEAAE